ncbi:MAG: tetratricopeptide repeat protein [Nitrospirae bacterium]|nr:tetratricopeptide repeat protein [Nitrospirota bacterium]
MGKAKRTKGPQRDLNPGASGSTGQRTRGNAEARLFRFGWLLPLLLSLGVNATVLFNGFAWDDAVFFVEQPDPTVPSQKIDGPALKADAYFRPLIGWSYTLDRAIWGLNPFGFHLSIYLAHALTTLLVYLSVVTLLRLYHKEKAEGIALLTASLFAVHPIHAEAVAWISGRSDIFMTLFMMIALYAYLRYRQGATSRITLPLFAMGCVLSLFSKETAIPFLLIFPVLDVLFHRSEATRWRVRLRRMKDPLIWVWAVGLGSFILYRLAQVGMPPAPSGGTLSEGNGITTLFIALGYYLKLLFIPHPLNLFVPELPTGPAGAIYGLIGLGGTLLLVWILIRRSRTPGAVGVVWFLLGMAAPAVVPYVRVSVTPVAERYAYLASGGFLLLVSLGGHELWRRAQARWDDRIEVRWAFIGAGVVVGLMSLLTVARNGVWRDEVLIWEDTVRKSPQAALPYYNLGNVYKRRGRPEEAARVYRAALTLKPGLASPHFNLGVVYEELGRLDEAIQEYQTGLKIDPNDALAHKKLANVLSRKGRTEDAEKEYQTALKLQPDSAVTHYNLGTGLIQQGRLEEAVREFRAAIRLDPDYQNAHYNLGLAYANQGKRMEAIEEFRTVVRLKPDDAAAHAVLGDLYKDQGKVAEAKYQYERALQLKPDFTAAREALSSLPKQ